MNRKQIGSILEETKSRFLNPDSTDRYLLEHGVNERSITHRFAEYLKDVLEENGEDWSVDCEYNRYGDDSKKIVEEIKEVIGTTTRTNKTKIRTVHPDIIVHRRGEVGPNLLVIEAKKDATDKERESDLRKLKLIKDTYGYQFSAFIDFLLVEPGIKIDIQE